MLLIFYGDGCFDYDRTSEIVLRFVPLATDKTISGCCFMRLDQSGRNALGMVGFYGSTRVSIKATILVIGFYWEILPF